MSIESPAPPTGPSRVGELVVGLIVLALFAWGYVTVFHAFRAESEKRFDTVAEASKLGPDRIETKVTVTGVDAVKGELTARIEFEPKGNLLSEDGYTLGRDVTMFVDSLKGKQMDTYKKGQRLTPVEVTLGLYDGDAAEYPFDKHNCELDLSFETSTRSTPATASPSASPPPAGETAAPNADASALPAKEQESPTTDASAAPEPTPSSEGAVQESLPPDEEDVVNVPISMEFETSVPGFRVDVDALNEKGVKGCAGADIEIRRTVTVKGFSIFIMTLIWSIALSILMMTFFVWRRGRKLEFSMLTFFAAMLFAFPAIRNLQPGSPPIGALPDFIAVFWAQAITAICLCIMLCVWVRRPVKG